MRIGLLGGTFDPLHFGHLHQARMQMEMHDLDEIWFIPASISPHKLDHPPVSGTHRLAMVKLATESEPAFRVLDLEVKRGGPSYTIDTVRELLSAHPDNEFFLLISDDMVAGLPKWKGIDELIELLPIFTGRRHAEVEEPPTCGVAKIDAIVAKGFTMMPVLGTNATDLRERLARGESCDQAIPESVLAYIQANHLYGGTNV